MKIIYDGKICPNEDIIVRKYVDEIIGRTFLNTRESRMEHLSRDHCYIHRFPFLDEIIYYKYNFKNYNIYNIYLHFGHAKLMHHKW